MSETYQRTLEIEVLNELIAGAVGTQFYKTNEKPNK